MKNKKGFTLIELLAVIVILAIIALIAVPIILNMINNARKSAAKSSALGYIDAIEYNNGFAAIEQPGYTSVTGTNVDVSTITVKLKGKKPSSGTVTINESGKVTSASDLCFNGYAVDYNGQDITDVTTGCNESSQPTIPEPVAFSTDSWATIAANTTSDKYHVGDEKTITMDVNGDNTPETYTLRIVNLDNPNECKAEDFSQTACGFVVEFVELLNVTSIDDEKMNLTDTNVGGWRDSKMRTYLNNETTGIYSKLPSDLRNVITSTKVISGHESGVSTNYETQDKLYLLMAKEVGVDVTYDSAIQKTKILKYYEEKTNTDRIKYKIKEGTDYEKYWWLRTARSDNTTEFRVITSSGSYGSTGATYREGISPAFRIGTNQ